MKIEKCGDCPYNRSPRNDNSFCVITRFIAYHHSVIPSDCPMRGDKIEWPEKVRDKKDYPASSVSGRNAY